MKHTKEPWVIDNDYIRTRKVGPKLFSRKSTSPPWPITIARIECRPPMTIDTFKSNCCLIAAAPDLLKAAQMAYNHSSGPLPVEILDMLDAAIEKATNKGG